MHQYLKLVEDVSINGNLDGDRTGTGTLSVFGRQMRFNVAAGFPLLTTKKVHLKSIIHELLWFLSGDTNIKYLKENGVSIWDKFADENGDLGPVYGSQWRTWPAVRQVPEKYEENGYTSSHLEHYKIDQIAQVVKRIKTHPTCRRLIVSAWNPAEVPDMALPPCHCLFQFHTRKLSQDERLVIYESKGYQRTHEESPLTQGTLDEFFDNYGIPSRALDLQLYQRSADLFLGVPFNIASYALLLMMIAQVTGLAAGDFIWTGGNCHIYTNHIDQINTQLQRTPRRLPKMTLNPDVKDIFSFTYDDFILTEYDPYPAIAGEVSV